MDNRPVGVLDSGLGGLTGMKALRELLPEENVVYFADSGRLPYGEKTAAQVRRMAGQNLALMASEGVKAILVACGTISSNAPDLLEQSAIPAFGVLHSSMRAMAHVPGRGPLGIIATEASIRSGRFEQALRETCPGREILAVACPDFVPLIESGHCGREDPLVRAAVANYLAPLRGADAVLLGCTHYGIIGEAIGDFLGEGTALVSAAESGAAALCEYLIKNDLRGRGGGERFLTSGRAEDFTAAASTFLGRPLAGRVEALPVMEV